MHKKKSKTPAKQPTKKDKLYKAKKDKNEQVVWQERKVEEKIVMKNQVTSSTMFTRSDPDRFLRTKRSRNKKNKENSNCRYISECSGSPLQTKIDLKIKEKIPLLAIDENEGNISFREYMMISDKWYPVISSTQRQKLSNFLEKKQSQGTNEKLQKSTQFSQDEQTLSEELRGITDKIMREYSCLQEGQGQNARRRKRLCGYVESIYNQLRGKQKQKEANDVMKLSPIKNDENHQGMDFVENEVQPIQLHSPIKFLQDDEAGSELHTQSENNNQETTQNTQKTCNLSQLVSYREFSQLGYSHSSNLNKQSIQTDVIAIGSFIQIVFEQLSSSIYLPQVLQNLSMAYGYPKLKKYSKISKSQELFNPQFQVIPQELFTSLISKYLGPIINQHTQNQLIHAKCIFDLINHELVKLKPYFESVGENFPWSFKLSVPITFYDINNESLGIVFSQIKDKILNKASMLCGLIVEADDLSKEDQQILSVLIEQRRRFRESYMCEKYITNGNWRSMEDNETEFEGIVVMNKISEDILDKLINEFSLFCIS